MATRTETTEQIPGFLIANIAINSVLAIPLLGLCATSFFLVRSRRDPARAAFVWMKVALPLYALSQLAQIPVYANVLPTITAVATNNAPYDGYEVSTRLDDVAWLIRSFGQAALVLALAELGLGLRLHARGRVDDSSRAVRYAAAAFMGGLWAVAVAYYALETQWVATFYARWVRAGDLSFWADSGLERMRLARRMQGAYVILQWVVSLFILGWAGATAWAVREVTEVRTISTLYACAAVVWLIPNNWELARQLSWLLRDDYDSRTVPMYVDVLKPLLDVFPAVVVLGLLFAMGRRREGGLWTTKQPWMAERRPSA